jgi:hypothetical protein
MLHRERLKPPSRDYPADEWNVIEKRFHPEFPAQLESMLALGNGYIGRSSKRVTSSSCHVGKPSPAILNPLIPIAGLAAIILNTTACSSR